MNPITYSGFSLREIISRAIPGFIFASYIFHLLFLSLDLLDLLNKTSIVLFITLISHPLGLTIEQFSLWFRERLFGKTSFLSDERLIKQYVCSSIKEFWLCYIKILSQSNSNVSSMIENYNILRFFFLNMSFISLLVFLINVVISRSFYNPFSLSLILSVTFFLFHIQWNRGFYIMIGFVYETLFSTNNVKDLT